jgi:ribonuclease P protein component
MDVVRSSLYNPGFTFDWNSHEAHLPAKETQTRPYTRVSRSHEQRGRPQRPKAPSRQGPQAAHAVAMSAALASPTRGSASRGPGRRLSRSTEFQRVYRQGRSKANRYLVLYSFARGDAADEDSRFGVSVGRKIGNAVVRNRVKRTIREALDQLEPKLADGLDYVVLARPDIVELLERDGMHGVRDSLDELITAGK